MEYVVQDSTDIDGKSQIGAVEVRKDDKFHRFFFIIPIRTNRIL